MSRPVPRPARVLLTFLAALVAMGVPAAAARADDGTASWAVAPSDADGNPTGATRFELEVVPGEAATEHVLVTNSSTVERAFDVYGADGFNTPTGGYDLEAAAVLPTDIGSWVTVDPSPVVVAALSTAVVEFTVAVPSGAAPGDHPGGIVVSPQRGQVTDDGVVVDTRIAVRLNVRVPGDVVAALVVRDVGAGYGFTAVPFASAPVTITYEVVNTGNVKVIGVPRVRITGPFGIGLADVEADETREVLPGDSFTVTTEVTGVMPLVLATATIDVEMAAAPGPDTEIPLVSSTARTTFLAMSWTGLAMVVALAVVIWILVSVLRRRRREGEQLWDKVVDEARADLEAGRAPRTGMRPAGHAVVTAMVVVGLAGWPAAGAAPSAQALTVAGDPDDGSITLTVPSVTTSTTVPSGSSGTSRATDGVTESPGEPPGTGEDAGATTTDVAAAPPAPDLIWPDAHGRWGGLQWSLVGLGSVGVLGLLAWLGRGFLFGPGSVVGRWLHVARPGGAR